MASSMRAIPGPPTDEPYASDCPLLPKSLPEALTALEQEPLFRHQLGDVFVDYFLKLKRNETGRFQRWLEEGGVQPPDNETTEWEQRRIFRFFLVYCSQDQWCGSQD